MPTIQISAAGSSSVNGNWAQHEAFFDNAAIPAVVKEIVPARAGHQIVVLSIMAEPVGADPVNSYVLLSGLTIDTIFQWNGSVNARHRRGICATDPGDSLAIASISMQTIDVTLTYMYVPA